jgi:hypothetical protein
MDGTGRAPERAWLGRSMVKRSYLLAGLLAAMVVSAGCKRHERRKQESTPRRAGTVANAGGVDEVVSPGKKNSAAVFSIVDGSRGNTQVMVSFGWPQPRGGAGVFAVDLPHVPLRLAWRDDSHLVVSYPAELKPSKRSENARFYEEAIEIEYQIYQGADLSNSNPRPGAATAGTAPAQKHPVPRGTLTEVSAGKFRYDYYDLEEPDSSYKRLAALGYQGGGPTWAGIVVGLVALQRPELRNKLQFDDEAEGLAIWSSNRAALEAVADLIDQAKRDPALMDRAMETAKAQGRME